MVLSDRHSQEKRSQSSSEPRLESTLEEENLFNWLNPDRSTLEVERPRKPRASVSSQPPDTPQGLDRTLDLLSDLLLDPQPESRSSSEISEEHLPPLVLQAELEEDRATSNSVISADSPQTPISPSQATSEPADRLDQPQQETAPELDRSLNALQNLLLPSEAPDSSSSLTQSSPSDRASNLSPFKSSSDLSLEERLSQLEQQTALINPLMPLVSELLGFDLTVSHEQSIRVLTPIIDKIIQNRAQEDAEAMSGVLADLIPAAIAEEIRRSPRKIAKALAPEVSLAIEEQIRIDRHAIAKAIGPEMGPAIKEQIECERDSMVDALYPVIGNTIAKYMNDVIQSINQKVESTFTLKGIQRKIKARVQGVSEAELIFQESMPYSVRAIFLIHKASGLVISEYQPSEVDRLESDMLAGMLTAIRSFVNDCISSDQAASELNEIEYDDCKILLEVAGYSYMAVVIKGEPSKAFLQEIQTTYSFLLQKFGEPISEFDGDSDTVPEPIPEALEKLFTESEKKHDDEFPWALILLILAVMGAIAIPWIWSSHQWHKEYRLEVQTRQALLASPELSVYAIRPDVDRETIQLEGRVPNEYLRSKAGEIVSEIAPQLTLDNDIVAVNLPPDLDAAATEVNRIVNVLNQLDGVNIKATYNQGNVTVSGTVVEGADLAKILDSLEGITGVSSVFSRIQLQSSPLEMKFYFESGSDRLHPADLAEGIPKIAQFLNQYPEFNLMITGHSDKVGAWGENQKLSWERAEAVKVALQQQGIASDRLKIRGTTEPPPGINSTDALALSRCVRFELFRPINVGN
ncbi:OmpA family protein [Roseofilum sp. BLCC_M91]|uniref:OmpA family protein n=1 Tax=Roseofilum halophilum BLCC-M91 TaxID=3022259 RepID=A0ABT7BDL9_9CYAN|nr:OmpA family protein [Roseofilum halophilum]MDJ1177270.1 OmpA family protein [Roseofilum halophilum BLCC-M91]